MQRFRQDLRFAIRQIRKAPGFAITTILTLALGIGATTAIFSLVNAVLLRPLPYPQQDRLVWLKAEDRSAGQIAIPDSLSYPDFFDWRAQQHSFTALAAYRGNDATLSGAGEAQQLSSAIVTADFFRVLGVRPILGRDFLATDEKPKTHVAMLSHSLWQSAFAGAAGIAGRAITLNGESFTVAGVMPADFAFPIQNPPVVLWTSAGEDDQFFTQRGADFLDAVGRLKPGISVTQAKADMDVIARNLATQYPDSNKTRRSVVAKALFEQLVGDTRPALRVLFGAVALVLLIACVNVAGLALARASRRRSDIALQAALGARQSEIVRQILVESVFLSTIAGAFGIALAMAIVHWLPRLVPADLPRLDRISVDGPMLIFAIAVSIGTGLLFGVLPAWRMSRFDPLLALRESGRGMTAGRGQHRLQSWLIMAEISVSMVLLIGSGLLIRSFVQVLHVDPGFDARNVLTANLSVPSTRYNRQQRIEFYHRLFARVAALPGIQSVAAGFPLPLSGNHIDISIAVEGREVAKGDEPSENMALVTPDFFRTLRIPILAGRAFTASDNTNGKPVMVVNDRFARKYFPGEDPIGKHIRSDLGDGTIKAPMREVVGVVGNIKRQGLTTEADPQYYLPWEQAVVTAPALCIRTSGDPTRLIAPLRAELAAMDRDVPLDRPGTLQESVYQAAAQPRFQTLLLTSFACMALLLCAIGLYGLLSYMVVQRAAEIGVRVALGAQRADVLGLILGRGLLLSASGVTIGLGASALLTAYLTSMLYGVPPLDAVTFASVTGIFLLVSLAASCLPAYRAVRLDPMQTLRDQ